MSDVQEIDYVALAPKRRPVPQTPRQAVRWIARRYLQRSGWIQSALTQRPVDGKGDPLPWYTYAMQNFLLGRLTKDMHVFEYGSGNSTLWYSERVAAVVSVEHDPGFVAEIMKSAPTNVTHLHRPPYSPGYWDAANRQGRKFDVVVVDGIHREECAAAAVSAVSQTGVVIVDNTDTRKYGGAVRPFLSAGFRQFDFRSHGPIWLKEWTTSIFYRDGNCFRI
jgi:hypothetical protein